MLPSKQARQKLLISAPHLLNTCCTSGTEPRALLLDLPCPQPSPRKQGPSSPSHSSQARKLRTRAEKSPVHGLLAWRGL